MLIAQQRKAGQLERKSETNLAGPPFGRWVQQINSLLGLVRQVQRGTIDHINQISATRMTPVRLLSSLELLKGGLMPG
jgi:hypothetical protein